MLVVTCDDVARRRGAIEAALAARVDAIQLRDRAAGGRDLLATAKVLRGATRRGGALLLVNDRIDVARAAGADGVHLPAASFPVAAARALLGAGPLIGRSAHAPDEVAVAAREGADYVILGPIFDTPSKREYGAPLGESAITAARAPIPVLAIGGVTSANAAGVLRAGASGIAVIREILDAPDADAAARTLVAAVSPRDRTPSRRDPG
jgi:thiamine-phosphate pyrophosphorylase